MNSLQNIIDHAEQQCVQHGTQLTEKRKKVLSSLLQSDRALTAYELIDYCKDHFDESLPAMSVYRILDFLESEQLVHKLNIANRYVACVHITCDHKHAVPQFLICIDCQRVEEISVSKSMLASLRRNIEAVGYSMVSPQLEMNCRCANCGEAPQ